jgi:23S rRNA pseudouridine1911/1915/1917 synthase
LVFPALTINVFCSPIEAPLIIFARVAKSEAIELPTGERIPILYEDRSVMAIDKPRGWMLVPMSWQNTGRNLQAALSSSIAARDFWARSRGLKSLRYIHRLDAETTGILLLGKSPGAVQSYTRLFESRRMEKIYLAVIRGIPRDPEWTSTRKIGPDPKRHGRMKLDQRGGKEAETRFRLLQTFNEISLLEARPLTGRTHQIRIHLAEVGHPVVGDDLYGTGEKTSQSLGLRAIVLSYRDPFTGRSVRIRAPVDEFAQQYGFETPNETR